MDYVITICGFLGAWLLVAGPIWQATIELQEEEIDRDLFHRIDASVPARDPVSRWWLLVAPVYWYKARKAAQAHRDALMAALPEEQIENTLSFLNKANGWFIVGAGAFLIAVKETWELCELLQWPVWAFVLLIVVATFAAIANAAARDRRTKHAVDSGESSPTVEAHDSLD